MYTVVFLLLEESIQSYRLVLDTVGELWLKHIVRYTTSLHVLVLGGQTDRSLNVAAELGTKRTESSCGDTWCLNE